MALAVPIAPRPGGTVTCGDVFSEDLHGFIDKYTRVWENAGSERPSPHKRYEVRGQRENERHLDLLITLVERRLRSFPDSALERKSWRDDILTDARRLCIKTIGMPAAYLDILLSKEYTEVTRTFVHRAREFDPEIALADLGQAMRNVWVTNYLQIFLDRRPSLNPAVFAYSMLYPYSDNYLDRPDVSSESKRIFNRRFGLRLGGSGLLPLEPHERPVFRLVELIEREYPRCEFPEVYKSLLAIHDGQVRSLEQQGSNCTLDLDRLLRISIEKGGSSVLADGYLIDGSLTRSEADFFFGFGVLLQLQDDLQDLQPDRRSQRWTIFSRTAAGSGLEGLTSRLYHFMNAVLGNADRFSGSWYATLKELIADNCFILMLQSIAINSPWYSRAFLRQLEQFSPLRFAYLRDLPARLEKRHAGIMKTFRHRKTAISVFDLIG